MGADQEARTVEQSGPAPGASSARPPERLSERLAALSDQLASTSRQLAELQADLSRHAAELEQRGAELAALDEREQQLEQSKAEFQATFADFEKQREQFARERTDLTQQCDQLASREDALQRREEAVGRFQQVLAQMAARFGDSDGALAAAAGPAFAEQPPFAQTESQSSDGEQTAPTEATDVPEAPSTPELEPPAEDADPGSPDLVTQEPAPSPNTSAEEAAAKTRQTAFFQTSASPTGESNDASAQHVGQQVLEADPDIGDSIDTIDITVEEMERMRVLRRLGNTLPDAKLIARIRAQGPTDSVASNDAGERRKSKRRWWS